MIQKRYQYFSREGKVWTKWFDFCKDDSQLERLKKENKWQMKNQLLNDYRIV